MRKSNKIILITGGAGYIGHMTLIAVLEEKFKISFETDDIVDFSSYLKGIEILKKYKIQF